MRPSGPHLREQPHAQPNKQYHGDCPARDQSSRVDQLPLPIIGDDIQRQRNGHDRRCHADQSADAIPHRARPCPGRICTGESGTEDHSHHGEDNDGEAGTHARILHIARMNAAARRT